MKKQITLMSGAAVLIGLCCAAVSSFNPPATPYNPEQIQGNVRVVLLRVDRTTVFTDVGFKETSPQKIHAVPGVNVIYAVELLGDEPIKHWNTVEDGKLISVKGKPLRIEPENIAGGGHGASNEYEHYHWGFLRKPAVTNPKRTHVVEKWERGLRVPPGKIDVRITTGFNEHKQEFLFKDVPLE